MSTRANNYLKFEPGQLIQFERGSYSDHVHLALVVTLKAFDLLTLEKEMRASFIPDPDGWSDNPTADNFIGWLIAQQYVAPVEVRATVHLGEFSEFEISE